MSEYNDIHPIELLNCDKKPFGHLIAQQSSDEIQDDVALPEKTQIEVQIAKANVQKLLVRRRKLYTAAVAGINDAYVTQDSAAAATELHTLYVPEDDVLEWISMSSNHDVARLAQWNVRRTRQLQASFDDNQTWFDTDTVDRADRLIHMDIFPKYAAPSVTAALGHYGVFQAMDCFEQGARNSVAYCSADFMSLSNLYADPTRLRFVDSFMLGTIFHERMHGAGLVRDAGFMTGIGTTNQSPMRWLEEASVSRASRIAMNPNIPLPTDTSTQTLGSYPAEQTLLCRIMEPDAADITDDLLYSAFFAPKDAKPRKVLEYRLANYFSLVTKKRYPDALYRFSKQYETAFYRGGHSRVVESFLKNVYGE